MTIEEKCYRCKNIISHGSVLSTVAGSIITFQGIYIFGKAYCPDCVNDIFLLLDITCNIYKILRTSIELFVKGV